MNKLFPSMFSKPEKGQIFALIPCWLWVFVLCPMFMPFLGEGLWEQWESSVWLQIGYHVLNGIILLVLISGYLKDEWFMVSADVRYYLKHVALTVGLTVGTVLLWTGILFLCGFSFEYICECLPIVEMSVSHTPLFLLQLQPILGAVVLSVFPPVSICALFYCLGFAPVCYKKPRLAYLSVAAITLIPPIIDILWRGDAFFVICGYLVNLPIHLIACWSYQKTDNVWTPLISLAVVNLLSSIIIPIILLL